MSATHLGTFCGRHPEEKLSAQKLRMDRRRCVNAGYGPSANTRCDYHTDVSEPTDRPNTHTSPSQCSSSWDNNDVYITSESCQANVLPVQS
ncbi:hypothetical protein BAUCODRAFT_464807 [Baudoinia panamericana UAMH 10762]|uniref:Uncharacterized protein n=1 Tax=Baudoinia panamericana (strain UAMH 10762) TaxID=717646 RepID=M2LP49_BAUPA|nr:uncharacterized protein BAUCODRAFT_464807 [Baudoinia panamericana UAMH 10762]EMC96152.1 hypothetical protein BAUCODRAFT_464807 [Baudoinia panamericana UAMH 10762]